MIKPLRDNIVVRLLDDPQKTAGGLYLPENKLQALLQHVKALVLYAGPIAKEQGLECGVIVHVSEAWGDPITHNGCQLKIGRSRDINGIVEGVTIKDMNAYLD